MPWKSPGTAPAPRARNGIKIVLCVSATARSIQARGGFMKRSSHLPMAKLAYRDPKFMESLGARPLRILAEYLDPLARLRREKVADTIVMFGSARIHSREVAQHELKEVRAR